MSYDIAVWEGDRPDSADEAAAVFADLAERYLEGDEDPPTEEIAAYVEALLDRWPGDDEDSPWASSRTGDASGPVLCVYIVDGREEDVLGYVADLAQEQGLVCYDLQEERLLP
jgi:hypothetical protein